ncbi:MAG: response regulator transcription factor [Eubacterium sp.]|nr:response regulator transcription factor [Eubacterium sp.]
MIRTVLLDDDALSRQAARAALSAYDEVEIIREFNNSADFFAFLRENPVDLLFLDIELDGETGFEIAGRMKAEHPDVMIVFLTGHSTYAIDGYDFSPVNFLVKPINTQKLSQTLDEVKRRMSSTDSTRGTAKIMLRLKNGLQIIQVADIRYFERRNRKIYMVCRGREESVGGYTMQELETMLMPYGFYCCHQSFLVSLRHITGLRDARRQLYEVTVSDREEAVPVSRHRYNDLLKRLKEIGNTI